MSQEAINYLGYVFRENDMVEFNMDSHDVESDYKEVLAKIYGEEIETILAQIQNLDSSWSFLNGNNLVEEAQKKIDKINSGKLEDIDGRKKRKAEKIIADNTLSAADVLIGLLKKTPLKDSSAYEVYFEGAKHLIGEVLDKTVLDSEKQSALFRIAKALGDCATPVKDTLIQGYIAKHRDSIPLPKGYDSLVAREAVESEILSQLRNKKVDGKIILRKNEEIEQVQGLTNAMFLEDGATNAANKCKMEFSATERPDTLPSKTSYVRFAFGQVRDQLALEFAKLCCKTDESGKLLKSDTGNYFFSSKKLRGMVEKYYKESLGIISQREAAINDYTQKVQKFMNDTELTSLYYDKPEILPLLDFKDKQQELREQLLEVSDSEVANVAAKYLIIQKDKIEKVLENIKKATNKLTPEEKIEKSHLEKLSIEEIYLGEFPTNTLTPFEEIGKDFFEIEENKKNLPSKINAKRKSSESKMSDLKSATNKRKLNSENKRSKKRRMG